MGQTIRNKSARLAFPSLPIDRATNLHFDRITKVLQKLGWKLVAETTTDSEKVMDKLREERPKAFIMPRSLNAI